MAVSGDTREEAERKAQDALKAVSGASPQLTRVLEV